MSLDIFPTSASNNMFNRADRTIKHRSQLSLGKVPACVKIPDAQNLLFSKNTSRMTFPRNSWVTIIPTFFDHICNIFCSGSKEKMTGSNASRIVAMVTYILSSWNRSDMKLIANPMREKPVSWAMRKLPIALVVFRRRPFPTCMKWNHGNLVPEPLLNCFHQGTI